MSPPVRAPASPPHPVSPSPHRRVLLYGKSVILGAVGASLRGCPYLEVVSLAPPLPAAQELCALAPDAIIFDLEAAHPDAALSLLQGRPRLLLIGLDPATDQMLLWSGEHSRALSMQDLVQALMASGGVSRPPAARSSFPGRLQTRKQKLSLALAALGLAACLGIVLWTAGGERYASLAWASLGRVPGDVGLAFAAGILLGTLLLGLWLRFRPPRR